MLMAVVGSAPLDRVAGITAGHPAALLGLDRATSHKHVVLLAPWYHETVAREQAHVLVAAAPAAHVAVLTPHHHPLTLALVGASARQAAGPNADPGVLLAMVRAGLARSRSLVWYPRVRGLREPVPTAGQQLASLFRSPGYFTEITTEPRLIRAKAGSPVAPTEDVYVAGTNSPALLYRHLGGAGVRLSGVELEPHQPYTTKSSIPLTVLAGVALPRGSEPPCPSCGAALVGGACHYCGLATASSAGPHSAHELVDHG